MWIWLMYFLPKNEYRIDLLLSTMLFIFVCSEKLSSKGLKVGKGKDKTQNQVYLICNPMILNLYTTLPWYTYNLFPNLTILYSLFYWAVGPFTGMLATQEAGSHTEYLYFLMNIYGLGRTAGSSKPSS
jgi:hypothetical protein